MKKLAIITTHPVQYTAPLFKYLTENGTLNLKVFYTWGEQSKGKIFDPGFGKEREWDIPLFDGYNYEFVKNVAKDPGSHHFFGIKNPDLIDRIKAYTPTSILVIGWNFHSHLQLMRYFKGKVPILFRGDSTLLDEPAGWSFKKTLRRAFLRWVYNHIDFALYVGTNNRNYYKAVGVGKNRLVYAPHAVDNDRFITNAHSEDVAVRELKAKPGIEDGKPVILFAGKLIAKKNPMFMIEAAKSLPAMHFVIVGNGALEKEITEAASRLENVTLLPFQNQAQMPEVYRLCDVFVLPSKGPGETWGLAINEAMACERIVVASNKCGGAVDLIEDGVNGYIIEPSAQSLVRALTRLQAEKDRFAEMKKASLRRVKNFSYMEILKAINRCMSTGENSKMELPAR